MSLAVVCIDSAAGGWDGNAAEAGFRTDKQPCRHPEVLAVLHGEPRRMGHKRSWRSFETPRERAAPQDDG
jgi:hypothetical protein